VVGHRWGPFFLPDPTVAQVDKLGKPDKLYRMSEATVIPSATPLAPQLTRPIRLVKLAKKAGARVTDGKNEMTPAQVAQELGVSPSTVRRYEKRGIIAPARRLPGSRYRRYSRADVETTKKRIEAGEFDQPTE
jgi:MerR-like DNA binding protein